MNRRNFLESIPLSGAAINALSKPDLDSGPGAAGEAAAPSAIPPGVPYFTREMMQNLVDTSLSLEAIKFETVVYNFPNYHPSPAQERYLGKGWTEWDILQRSKPLFPGHLWPKYPLWGYFDESDPVWAEREIEAASSHGVNIFMIDWFWYNGTQLLQEQLEQGFLKARNRQKMRFGIMWANVDWQNQYPPPDSGICAALYKQTYSDADMDRIADYWIEHYFREPNYWRLEGAPVVGLFKPTWLLQAFSPQKLRATFDRMRNRAAKAGLNGIHFQASDGYQPGKDPLKEYGYDSATHYQTFDKMPHGKLTEYVDGITFSIRLWQESREKLGIPYFPDCPIGLDNSSRYGLKNGYVFVHRTPDQYALFLEAAKYFVAAGKARPPLVFMSAWNEWTEDHVMLPDACYGYAYLESVRSVFLK